MFAAYTSGRPPREIAQDLNREGFVRLAALVGTPLPSTETHNAARG
ncbi:hypothetical protein NKH89_29655 [Mesorhizobium sp. M0923]